MAGPIFHLPSVSWHTGPRLWDRGASMYRQTGVRKDPPQRQHNGILSRCGDELERLMGANGKDACSLRIWRCFLNMGRWEGRAGRGL